MTFEQGNYIGIVTNWGLAQAKTKTNQFWMEFEVQGQKRTAYWALTEKTVEYVARDLAKLGYFNETLDQLDPQHPHYHDFHNLEVELYCKHEDYKGELKERWQLAMSGGDKTPIESNDLRRLNALFGKALKANAKSNLHEIAVDESQPQPVAVQPDDDIPPF